MRKLLALSVILASPALAQQPNGTINAPIYATGYISQVGGTNVTTKIPAQPNHPTNLNIYTTGAISGTWSIQLPNPAFEGQILSFNCGAAANAIAITSSDGSALDSAIPTSCVGNSGFTIQFDQRLNIWRNIGSNATTSAGVVVNNNTQLTALPATISVSMRLGYAAAGDAPPVLYTRSNSACSLNAGAGDGGYQVPTNDGKCWIADTSNGISTLQYGIDVSGASSAVSKLQSMCSALNAIGGGTLTVNKGTYKIDATIDCSGISSAPSQTTNWSIAYEPGARFVATSALTTSVWKIFDNSGTHTMIMDAPNIDVSGASCDSTCKGGEGVTAIELQGMAVATVNNPVLIGGTSYTNDNSNNGITTTKVKVAQINGGSISGFPNGGVYTVGDLAVNSPKGYTTTIIATSFTHNNTAVECKFSLDLCSVQGATFDYNRYGLSTWIAGTEPSARVINWTGNTIRHSLVRAIHVEAQTKGAITGNVIEDIGYNESDVLTTPGASALLANGASGLNISGNIIRLRDWANSGFACFTIGNATLGGTPFTAGNLSGGGNRCEGFSYGVYEGAGVAASSLGLTVSGVATPATITNAASIYDITSEGVSRTIYANSSAAFTMAANGVGNFATRPIFTGCTGFMIGQGASQATCTSVTGLLKGAGASVSAAVSGTDYAPATSGTAILKGNGAGAFSNAAAGTDYLAPNGSGAALTGITGSQIGGFTSCAIPYADGSGNLTQNAGLFCYSAGRFFLTGDWYMNAQFASSTAPTIASGFCTSPAIASSNGTLAFEITIGSACAASTGQITLPTASHKWVCDIHNLTTPASNKPDMSASTTTSVTFTNYSRTTGVATNWTAAETLVVKCAGY